MALGIRRPIPITYLEIMSATQVSQNRLENWRTEMKLKIRVKSQETKWKKKRLWRLHSCKVRIIHIPNHGLWRTYGILKRFLCFLWPFFFFYKKMGDDGRNEKWADARLFTFWWKVYTRVAFCLLIGPILHRTWTFRPMKRIQWRINMVAAFWSAKISRFRRKTLPILFFYLSYDELFLLCSKIYSLIYSSRSLKWP